jgi:hypothetical protein
MKNTAIVFLVMVACIFTAGPLYSFYQTANAETSSKIPGQVDKTFMGILATPEVQQVAQITATPSQTPLPTVDLTAISSTLQAKDTALQAAINEKLIAQAEMQNAVGTQQAEHVAGLVLTVTLQAQDIEQANIALTKQSVQSTSDEAARIQRRIELTATVEAPALIKKAGEAEAEAKTAPARAIIRDSFWPLLVVAGFILSVMVIRKRYPALEQIDANELEQDQPRRVWKPASSNHLIAIIPPGDQELFRKFAEYALAGGLLGINKVENSKAYPRDPYCFTLLPWMQRQEYIGHDHETGGAILNAKGQEDFRRWMNENPPPPSEDLSKNAPPPQP